MTSEGAFFRGSPERSSLGSRAQRRGNSEVELARHRAIQAANLYHTSARNGVHGDEVSSSSSKSSGGFTKPHATATRTTSGPSVETGPPHPGDFDYKQKLRSGFIDLRNSYNEKLKPRNVTYTRGLSSSIRENPASGYSSESSHSDASRRLQVYDVGPVHRTLAERRGLYRSNSSLELDQQDYVEYGRDPSEVGPLRRNYGSTSSLDLISAAGGDSFFAMLQDYRNENLDQRAPPPPAIQEVLRGRADLNGGALLFHTPVSSSAHNSSSESSRGQQITYTPNHTPIAAANNSSSPIDEDSPDGSQSPKLKSKSQKHKDRKQRTKSMLNEASQNSGAAGLFRKLRGKTETGEASTKASDNDSAEARQMQEQIKRTKAFAHFDCQSVGVSLSNYNRRKQSTGALDRNAMTRNVMTGASQASGKFDDSSSEETDAGDGRSNDLLLSCPFFRNELGGEEERNICLNRRSAQKRVQQLFGNSNTEFSTLVNSPICNGITILDISQSPSGDTRRGVVMNNGLVVEHVDHGACYYRNYFSNVDHQNFVGIDDRLGAIAVSIRREKLDEKERETLLGQGEGASFCYQYRIIVRTSELNTLRGSVLEEAIPSSSRLSTSRGLPAKEVLEYAVPDLPLGCLKLTNSNPKTIEQIIKLDEQGLSSNYKVGVLLCRAGQATEEDMYNNEHSTPALKEFLECIGQRVRLSGFDKYRGGLDCKTDTTGTESYYAQIHNCEIMFHVASMLPYTTTNGQQLPRKRHIGNDIVTIIFQEPGAHPFTPQSIRSQFQHVFIIVRALHPITDHVKYSLSVARSKDVPPFGPLFAEGALFNKSPEFAQYLLTKVINAENAVHRSEKFIAMATRTRLEYLKDLAMTCATNTSLEASSKLSKFSLGSGRRKEKPKVRTIPDMYSRAGLVWKVKTEDFGQSSQVDCHLAIGAEMLTLIDAEDGSVVMATPCKSVLGWSPNGDSIRLYINQGECVVIKTSSGDIQEIVSRLSLVTPGELTLELTLRRNGVGQLGFHVHREGLVSDIERHGYAWEIGMRDNCRLVEVCKVAMATLTHDQLIDLLRTSATVKVVVIPPRGDGTPRRAEKKPVTLRNLISYPDPAIQPKFNGHFEGHPPDNTMYPVSSNVSIHSQSSPPNYQDAVNRTTHSKQPSHDSLASRSSGRGSEGHTSTHGSRHDLHRSGEMSGSSDGMHALGQNQTGGQGWSGKVTVYPAYSKEHLRGSQPNLSPNDNTDSPSNQWLNQSSHSNPSLNDPHGDIGNSYHSNPTQPAMPHSAGPGGEWKGQELSSSSSQQGYVANDSTSSLDRHTLRHTEETQRYPSSMTNLSQLNEAVSSQSSPAPSVLLQHHEDRDNVGLPQTRMRQDVLSGSRKGRSSPYATSPHMSRRGIPEEHSSHGSSRKAPLAAPSTARSFQADLMRLINPDVSFNLGEEEEQGRVFQLTRTKSEESVGTPSRRHVTHQKAPTPPPRDDSKDRRISPQVSNDTSGTLLRVRSTQRAGSKDALPLPESTSGLEWNTLVDTATKAMEKSHFGPSGSGQNLLSELPNSSTDHTDALAASSRTPYIANPASKEHEKVTRAGSNNSREVARPLPRWRSMAGTAEERVPVLEAHIDELERQLIQEREERDAMEVEMQRLRYENVHLQQESTAAAEQLRKFTEWFFNTMDRQEH